MRQVCTRPLRRQIGLRLREGREPPPIARCPLLRRGAPSQKFSARGSVRFWPIKVASMN